MGSEMCIRDSLDTNDDGQGDVGFEGGGIESDEAGPFTMAIKVCEKRD